MTRNLLYTIVLILAAILLVVLIIQNVNVSVE